MSNTIGIAYVQIEPSTQGISGKMSGILDKEATTAGTSAGGKLSSALGGAFKTGLATIAGVTTAVIGAGTALANTAAKTAEYGDEIDKMSQKLGLSTDAYQEWDYVMKLAGTSMSSMGTGLKTLTNKMDDAKNGSEKAQGMFAQLGISMDELSKMSREDLFSAAITGFQQMEDSTERAALANDLFGKSGQELAPLFNTTSAETKELMNNLHEMGGVMSNEAVKASAQFEDSLTTMQTAFNGIKNAAMSELLPSFSTIMDGFSDLITGVDGGKEKIAEGFKNLFTSIKDALPDIIKGIESLLEAILENLPDMIEQGLPVLIEGCVNLVVMLVKHLPEIIWALIKAIPDIIKAILEGFGELGGMLIDLFASAWEGIKDVFSGVGDWLGGVWDGACDAVEGAWDGVTGFFEDSWELTKENWSKAGEFFGGVFDSAKETVSNIWDGVTGLFSDSWEMTKSNWSKAGEWFGETFSSAKETISNVWNKVTDVFSDSWQMTKDNYSKATGWFKDTFSKAKDGITSVWGKVTDFFGGIWDKIKGVFGNAWESFKNIGTNLIEGIKTGIQNAWNKFKNWVTNLFSGLVDGVKSIFGINSPSKVFADEIGKWIPAGVAVGIEGNLDTLDDSMVAMQTELLSNDLSVDANIGDYDVTGNNSEIISLLNQYLPNIGNQQVVLDTGVLVGNTVNQYNTALGQINARRT